MVIYMVPNRVSLRIIKRISNVVFNRVIYVNNVPNTNRVPPQGSPTRFRNRIPLQDSPTGFPNRIPQQDKHMNISIVYDPNEPEDDMREREEEMERMREHVFKESDTNKDHLISYDEFMAETKREEFEKDPGWETMDMDEEDDFTDDEFRAYQAQRDRYDFT